MIDQTSQFPLPRPRNSTLTRVRAIALSLTLGAVVVLSLSVAGCDDRDVVQVKLQQLPANEESPLYLQINAQVAGPTAGLRYKWFALSGECEPQESDDPKTVFKFGEGARQDQVSVEIWRANKCVAQGVVKVKFDDLGNSQKERPTEYHIEFTQVPPADIGGSNTHADISGNVRGDVHPDHAIAIYARAYGKWYVQPEQGSLLKIKPDGTWGSWTHTGSKYAALLVRQDFEPLTKLDMLPQTNDSILALEVVEGLHKDQLTNAAPSPVPPAH